jgi:hypothetical protein
MRLALRGVAVGLRIYAPAELTGPGLQLGDCRVVGAGDPGRRRCAAQCHAALQEGAASGASGSGLLIHSVLLILIGRPYAPTTSIAWLGSTVTLPLRRR